MKKCDGCSICQIPACCMITFVLSITQNYTPDLDFSWCYALYFYRSQNALGWSKFFVLDQKFIDILWQSQNFCARKR